MRIVCVGGGPGGLYFARLMKRADPRHSVTVLDRAPLLPPGDGGLRAFPGAGIVLSDGALASLETQDPDLHLALAPWLTGWSEIVVSREGRATRCDGHAFSGLSRARLVETLTAAAREVGVAVRPMHVTSLADLPDADLVVGADGARSTLRRLITPTAGIDAQTGSTRYLWLSTPHVFSTFAFLFRSDAHGLWRAHAYPHAIDGSTVVVECTEATWRAAGMEACTPDEAAARLARSFAAELHGQPLHAGQGDWQAFVTTRVTPWWSDRVVLLGDAAHTVHFSVGSGTRLAMDDAVALRAALTSHPDLPTALAAYEAGRRPAVESLQRAARASADWFEHAERYQPLDDDRFAFSLLTRSLRVTHADLRAGDPAFVARVDARVTGEPATVGTPAGAGVAPDAQAPGAAATPPPMFTPLRLRGLTLANRVVVSPMCQYSATDGTVNDWHLVHLGALAGGGAGLVLAEATAVSAEGRITEGCAGLYADDHTDAWRRIVEFVHRDTGAAVGIQLGHAGRKAATLRPWEGDAPMPERAWAPVAPSAVPFSPRHQTPRALTRTDMDRVVADYVAATRRADAAGFDWLELHMAHGYLLASFISPLSNQRTDEYGGALPQRMRFPLEVFSAVRAAWPQDRPTSVRISASDWAPGGLTPDESVEAARLLKAAGCDAIDVSTGGTVPAAFPAVGRLYQTPFAERIRFEAEVITMAVGAIASWADVNTIVAAGRADLCLLARGHLFDPYWTRHAAAAQGYALPWPKQYARAISFLPR